MKPIKQWFKSYLELVVALATWARTRASQNPLIIIFPDERVTGSAGDLRGWQLAPALRGLGWTAICLDPCCSLRQRRLAIWIMRPTLLYFQQTRHELNDPALYPGIPAVLDADDADILDPRHHQRIAATARKCLGIVAGSRFVRDQFLKYAGNVTVVWTSTTIAADVAVANKHRPKSVTWAHSDPINYPLEAAFVLEVALKLADRTEFQFDLFGIDAAKRQNAENYLAPLAARGVRINYHEPLSYVDFIGRLGVIAVGLQPVCLENEFSRGKSFGKLLAYMAADVAVVASNNVDHPLFFRDGYNGRLLANDTELWASACQALLERPAARQGMADAAKLGLTHRLSTARAAQLVDAALRSWLSSTVTPDVPAKMPQIFDAAI